MTDDTYANVIERGERYNHVTYGEVLVTGFTQRIDAVYADCGIKETLLVTFNKRPDSDFTVERYMEREELDEFQRSLDTNTQTSNQE